MKGLGRSPPRWLSADWWILQAFESSMENSQAYRYHSELSAGRGAAAMLAFVCRRVVVTFKIPPRSEASEAAPFDRRER
ncbi:jg2008 [Pararge aegeria aegeria]|uniref:Jg2008 protein n=1 Tax=Pararge aegeria aegeria TaxID=348720 RepID=A0A8S4S9M0_9NEOP|nr:jg2008 [Pararge aegeria aegeria]